MNTNRRQRSGGRATRRALHCAPLAENVRAIRTGLESGRYQPLLDRDIEKINHAVMDIK